MNRNTKRVCLYGSYISLKYWAQVIMWEKEDGMKRLNSKLGPPAFTQRHRGIHNLDSGTIHTDKAECILGSLQYRELGE